jgi:outer membrane protein OmpA-like peptidoglycan-associated protein/opacity protein-like surface antigen
MKKLNYKISTAWVLSLTFAFIFTLASATTNAQSQGRSSSEGMELPRWNIKTNLLYDATATINLGAEFRLSDNMSLDLPFNYNPFQFSNNRKWKHFLAQPEVRWWFSDETFKGHFLGAHAHYAFYNIGNLPNGPFSQYMQDHRFEGWAAGVGVSYGHRWNFSHRWALEATVGVGYMYKDYNTYECYTCGEYIASTTKHYFGPTKVGLNLIYGIGGKKGTKRVVEAPAPAPVYAAPVIPAPTYQPNLSASYVIPEVERVKARSQSYSAYLSFEQGQSEVLRYLDNNSAELRRINEITRSVAEDGASTISRIVITGYASPEDTYDRNLALSERRTQAVRDYVSEMYDLPYGVFQVEGRGEDWNTLDSLVAASNISDKYRTLDVIRGGGNPDARESRLKQLSSYRRIYEEFYPRLRRTDYCVNYTVAGFSVEEGKRVFRTHPQNLSLNEMYMIAKTYEPGGNSFNEVFETAVRLFPTSDVANINASAAALERRDIAAAAGYLARVKEQTPAYWNNMGVLQWLQGNHEAAAESFSRAGIQSMGNASEVERFFRSAQ